MVAISLANFKAERLFLDDIPKNMLVEYVLASASLPLMFKLEEVNGNKYIDGGFMITYLYSC